ncbi:MAG: hypothetical protein EBQ96_07295 [Proteobacteria bacterium]|nr:hypothetical protein [Pseudomonadota bacterium]
MSSILSTPDVLLLGSNAGIAQARALLPQNLSSVSVSAESLRSPEEVWEVLLRAVSTHAPESVFVASHRISVMLPEFAEGDVGIPIHRSGVPLADAARLTCTRRVGLIALPETLAHEDTQEQLRLYAERGLRIVTLPATDLVYPAGRYADEGIVPDIAALRAFIDPLRMDVRIDSVILASSHASALRRMLEKAAFRPFYWIDGIAVSVRKFIALRADNASRMASGTTGY